ncbi:MAG: hypothetical protein HY099_04625, partial [Nitrospirae bacterium]|nr:hypothetical protein [Nitrospirota bacterium]
QRTTGDKDIILLECYNTGDLDDIIDILELYDIEERTFEAFREKLEELAYTVSVLIRETLFFDFTQNGHLGLYLSLNSRPVKTSSDAVSFTPAETTLA